MTALRSLLFFISQMMATAIFATLMIVSVPWGRRGPHYFAGAWCRLMILLARLICGVHYRVIGWENLPPGSCVVLAKHQSAWETMFFPAFFPPHCFVLKKEILKIPFFGWGMGLLDPIAIDRDQRREAFQQVMTIGQSRLENGLSVIIFPEGTRVPYGRRARYAPAGGLLAAAAGVPVLPVAHDAGRLWGKSLLDKRPGTITISFGPAIDTTGRDGIEVSKQAEAWIESQLESWSGQPARFFSRRGNGSRAAAAKVSTRHRLEVSAGESVQFRVARRQRRTIGLIVDQHGLTVAVPPWVGRETMERAIREQWPWVQRKLQEWESRAAPPAPRFRAREGLPCLGKERRLNFSGGQLSLFPESTETTIDIDPDAGPVAEQVEQWYRDRALPLFEERTRHFAGLLGFAPPPVQLSNAKGRWGSCNSRGEIRLNWRLYKASLEEIDYVVAHEVAHLRHMDHSPRFWAVVERLFPDYKRVRTLLRHNDLRYRSF